MPRIVVVGAGIAGSLIVAGLAGRRDIELICLERVGPDDHAEAGTGLNIGPNAMKCLAAHLPESAAAIVANSLPWARWTISLTDGRVLLDLPLDAVADNPGIRIRWAELYSLLRKPIAEHIVFNAELTGCERGPRGTVITWRDRITGETHQLADIDLLIAGDGRYSLIRNHVLGGPEVPHFTVSASTACFSPPTRIAPSTIMVSGSTAPTGCSPSGCRATSSIAPGPSRSRPTAASPRP